MLSEVWKSISGFENIYEVSSFGRVRNKKKRGKILSQGSTRGYKRVELWKDGHRNGRLVHRLVAQAFLPNFKGNHVHHKNHIREDNRADNLEWTSIDDNMIDMWIWGLKRLGYKIEPPGQVQGVP